MYCNVWADKDKTDMHIECKLITNMWEECDEFLVVEPNTLQSCEVGSVHPLNSISTDDVPCRNSNDHVSHATLWSNVWTYPPVYFNTIHHSFTQIKLRL